MPLFARDCDFIPSGRTWGPGGGQEGLPLLILVVHIIASVGFLLRLAGLYYRERPNARMLHLRANIASVIGACGGGGVDCKRPAGGFSVAAAAHLEPPRLGNNTHCRQYLTSVAEQHPQVRRSLLGSRDNKMTPRRVAHKLTAPAPPFDTTVLLLLPSSTVLVTGLGRGRDGTGGASDTVSLPALLNTHVTTARTTNHSSRVQPAPSPPPFLQVHVTSLNSR
ncbi:hypothetical protein E2C01_024072 [Portunus trituberculatus]|uniref:Uncharacterized protein n=1 Tax=Portunus trituberculatus TaxID=210409 RepID=A0A5B7EDF3_PORTR|nr:hypothetical protein [Portunus trituberculatus]